MNSRGLIFFEDGPFLLSAPENYKAWNFSSVTRVYKELKLNWKDSY